MEGSMGSSRQRRAAPDGPRNRQRSTKRIFVIALCRGAGDSRRGNTNSNSLLRLGRAAKRTEKPFSRGERGKVRNRNRKFAALEKFRKEIQRWRVWESAVIIARVDCLTCG